MRFNSSKAWNDAAQAVAANRDVLLALAGVFTVLPLFALAVFVPQPELPVGADAKAMFALIGAYYRETWPAYLAATLVNLIGTLTMLALFTDGRRPTVGQAIGLGVMGVPTVVAAQILMGLGFGLAALLMVVLFSALGVLALLVAAAALVLAIWVGTRLALVPPAVMVDGLRNPIAALQRSWQLTQGNAGRLIGFLLLVGIAFAVTMLLVQMVLGLVLGLLLTGEAGTAATALVSAVLQAVMSVYFIAVIAASHRQLASGSAEQRLAASREA